MTAETHTGRCRIGPEDRPPQFTVEEWMSFCDEMMKMLTPEQIRRQKELEEQIVVPFVL